jgi:ribose transport system substrate-binding protein
MCLTLGAAVAACSSTSGHTNSSSTAGAPSTGSVSTSSGTVVDYATQQLQKYSAALTTYPPVTGTIDASKLRGKTVDWISFGLKIPYEVTVQAALQKALGEAGIRMRTCDGQLTSTVIADCLTRSLGDGASAVITDYIPYALVPSAVAKVIASGVPIYLAASDRPASVTPSAKVAFSNPDDFQVPSAQLAADTVIKDSNGKADVLFIKLTSIPSVARAGDAGITEFKQHCPGCTVVVKTFDSTNLPQLPQLVSSALISNPNITYVVPQTETVLAGAISGVQSAGLTGKIKFATTTGTLAGLQQLKANSAMLSDVGIDGTYTGWTEADAIMHMMSGQVPSTYASILRVFDRDNVSGLPLTADAQNSGQWYGSDAYQDAFLKSWGLS